MSSSTPAQPVQEFFSIGEVCQLTDLKPHVLRYWESQFRFLNPAKNRSGNRVYQRREIELIMLREAPALHREVHDRRRAPEDRAVPPLRASSSPKHGARWRRRPSRSSAPSSSRCSASSRGLICGSRSSSPRIRPQPTIRDVLSRHARGRAGGRHHCRRRRLHRRQRTRWPAPWPSGIAGTLARVRRSGTGFGSDGGATRGSWYH